MKSIRILFVLALTLITFSTALQAQNEAPNAAELIWDHPAHISGDYDALLEAWTDEIIARPDTPTTEFLLRRFRSLRRFLRDPNHYREALKKIETEATFTVGFNFTIFASQVDAEYASVGDFAESKKWTAKLGYLTEWQLIGGFGHADWAALYQPWGPENKLDLDAVYPADRDYEEDITWHHFNADPGDDAVNPFQHTERMSGVGYAVCQFKVPEATEATLFMDAITSYRIQVNGEWITSVDIQDTYAPSKTYFRLQLAQGWNRLLIKLNRASFPGFRVRLGDSKGWPFKDVIYAEAGTLHTLPENASPQAEQVRWGAYKVWCEEAEAAIERDVHPEGTIQELQAALIAINLGDQLSGHKYLQAAYEGNTDLWYVPWLYSLYIYDFEFIPDSVRRDWRLNALQKAMDANPDVVEPILSMASYKNENDQVAETWELLQRAREINPGHARVQNQILDFLEAQEWWVEREKLIREIEKDNPQNFQVVNYRLAQMQVAGKLDEAMSLCEEQMERFPEFKAVRSTLLEAQGRDEELLAQRLEELEDRPNSTGLMEEILSLHVQKGDYKGAVEWLEKIREQGSDGFSILSRLADLQVLADDKESALASYRAALTFSPGNRDLRNYLDHVDGTSSNITERFAIDVTPLIPTAPGREEYPKAPIVFLLDHQVVEVHADGTYTETVHQAYKIMNDEGINNHSNVPMQGEILSVRTHTPNGQILEPVVIPGQRELTMPGIEIGAIVEYKFRSRGSGSSFQNRRGRFYFRDPDNVAPFLISQLITIVPDNVNLVPITRNEGVRYEAIREGDRVIHTWTARDMDAVEPEPGAPSIREYIPYCTMIEPRTWNEIGARYAEYFTESARLTPELQAQADEIVAGIENPEHKARAIYTWVKKHIKTADGPSDAHGAWLTGTGNRLFLMKALLTAAGLETHIAMIRDNEIGLQPLEWEIPQLEAFSDGSALTLALQVALPNGESLWLDINHKRYPFNQLSWAAWNRPAFLIDPIHGSRIVRTPSWDIRHTRQETHTAVTVDENGRAAGVLQLVYRQSVADSIKGAVESMPRQDLQNAFERILSPIVSGIAIAESDFSELDANDEPFVATLKFSQPELFRRQEDTGTFRLPFRPAGMTNGYIRIPERKLDLVLPRPEHALDTIEITLPEGATLPDGPPTITVHSQWGTYSLSSSLSGNKLVIRRAIDISHGRVTPEEYEAFMKFCRDVDKADRQQIRLSF